MWLTLKLPETAAEPLGKARCAFCGSSRTRIYERISKTVKDPNISRVVVERRLCESCGRTFRHHASGVGRGTQTSTLRALTILLYSLGLSYSRIASLLEDFGVNLAKSTVWRTVRSAGKGAHSLHSQNADSELMIGGVTSAQLRKEERKQTLVVKDLVARRPLHIEFPDTKKGRTLFDTLIAMAKKTGFELTQTKKKSRLDGRAEPGSLQKDPYVSRLRKGTRKKCKQLTCEAEQLSKGATTQERIRLQVLIDDCSAIAGIFEGKKEVSERGLWQIYRRYAQAKAPGKGGKATIWYRMRLFTLKLWDESNRIVRHLRRPDAESP